MGKTENDTIYFLILWLIAMFLTLATGILIIMYQVRCFPCQNNDVGTEHEVDHKHRDFHSTHLDPKNMRTCMVCGEVMSTEEEGEIHQSCHDVDVIISCNMSFVNSIQLEEYTNTLENGAFKNA